MEISPKQLESFRQWMLRRGRHEDTADLYVSNLRQCAADPKGLLNRLLGKKLSPKTRRTNKAALAAWAKFTKDGDLRNELEEVKLPPAHRVTAKVPHTPEEWKKFVGHLRTCKLRQRDRDINADAMRQVLLIIAIRGLRCGDVLRIERTAITRALGTGVLSYIGKGGKRHEISALPIRPQLETLAGVPGSWACLGDLVSSGKSRRAPHRKVQRQLISAAKKIGIKGVYPHRFRRTFATSFLAELKGDPNALVKLKDFMQWESINTAAQYVDAVSQEQLDTIGAGIVSGLLG